jgi:hypothetical protein
LIEQIIDEVLRTHKADRAVGWLYDANHYFDEDPAWEIAKSVLNDDPRCVLEMKAILQQNCPTLSDVQLAMQRIWSKMSWYYWNSTSFTFYNQAAVLRFATMSHGKSSCLTGRMIVAGNRYLEVLHENRHPQKAAFKDAPFDIDFSDVQPEYVYEEDLDMAALDRQLDSETLEKLELGLKTLSRIVDCGSINSQAMVDSSAMNILLLMQLCNRLRHRDAAIVQWRRDLAAKQISFDLDALHNVPHGEIHKAAVTLCTDLKALTDSYRREWLNES